MKTIRLNNNTSIPVLGLGTWMLNGEQCTRAILKSFEVGYRHIDTADMYGNHGSVAKAISDSGLKRDDIFLTTKIPPSDTHKEEVISKFNHYLEELKTPYVDLLLIHWPNRNIPIQETLHTMNRIKGNGKIKAIGVSNFTVHHLEDAIKTGVKISVNQVELHPKFNQINMKEYCDSKKIVITAYSPFGKGAELDNPDPLILKLSKKYDSSISQVILNWIMARGIAAIPKSSNSERIKDNFQSTKWQMEKEDLRDISNLQQENRLVNPTWSEFNY